MVIDFSKIETKEFKNFREGEGSIFLRAFDDDAHKIMKATLKPGSTIGFHAHELGSEIIYIISGEANVLDGNEECIVKGGMSHYCSTKNFHSVRNYSDQDLTFFAVITKY